MTNIGGTISISENVAQNMYVYPNVTGLSINIAGKSFMDFSYSDISWCVNNSQNNITIIGDTFDYKTLIDASYLIPYNADNIQLLLKATYSPGGSNSNISSILRCSSDVSDTTFYPSGTLDISGINVIKYDNEIVVKPNIDNVHSKPTNLDICYNEIKWTIKGTDISVDHSKNYSKNELPTLSFTKENIMAWKTESDTHPDSQLNNMPQIRLSLNAVDINKYFVFSNSITTQFVEISGNIFEKQTISPSVLYADDSSFTDIKYNVYDYSGIEISALSKTHSGPFTKDNIHDASFTIPNATDFVDSTLWTKTNRPTVKLSINISKPGRQKPRKMEVTNNILFAWDENITSTNSYLDLSGLISLDNVTQDNIIGLSTNPDSNNLSSLITMDGVFIPPAPTTLNSPCTVNYSKFIEWGKFMGEPSFNDISKNIIVENIGNNWHINLCYNATDNSSTILSLSFERLFTGINKYRDRTTTRITNIQYKYYYLNNTTQNISNSQYPDIYSQDNIHDAFLDVKNISLSDNIKETTRLQITYEIYEKYKENKERISKIYDYNLVHFQNNSSNNALIPGYLVGGHISEPLGSLDFSSIYQINNKILWPTNIIKLDATKINTTAKRDNIFFDNVKFTLCNISNGTSEKIKDISYGTEYFTEENINDLSFELFDNLAINESNSYELKVSLIAYSLGERDINYYTDLSKIAFTKITRANPPDKSKYEQKDFSFSQVFSGKIPFDGILKANNNVSTKHTIEPNDNIYPCVNDLSFGRFGGDNSQITYDNVQWQFIYDNSNQKYKDTTWWGNGVDYQTGNININNNNDASKTELWNKKHTDASYGNWGYWMDYHDNIYNYENIKNAFFKVPIDSVGTLQLSMRLRYNNATNDFSQNTPVPMFSTFVVNTMSAGGDPMIMTINGDMYKMSNFNGYSRMLQGMIHNKPIFINVETTESTKEECLEASTWVKNQLKDNDEFNNMPEESYLDYGEAFMRKLWLSYNGCEMLIDMDKQRILNNTFENIKIYANDEKHIFPFYKNEEIPEMIEIHLPNLGKLFVGYYDNPQIRTCFHFESEVDIINAGGAIVHCLNAESIQIPSLTSTEIIHAHGNDECKYIIQYAVVTTNDESEKEITNINCY